MPCQKTYWHGSKCRRIIEMSEVGQNVGSRLECWIMISHHDSPSWGESWDPGTSPGNPGASPGIPGASPGILGRVLGSWQDLGSWIQGAGWPPRRRLPKLYLVRGQPPPCVCGPGSGPSPNKRTVTNCYHPLIWTLAG